MTDEYVAKTMHAPFFGDLASTHDQMCDYVSPTSTHNLKSKRVSPTITHGDQTT